MFACLFVCLFEWYAISTFVKLFHAKSNLFKKTVLFQTTQLSISAQFIRQKTFLFQAIQSSQTFLFQTA